MSTNLRPRSMWCLGLATQDVACISACVGKECRVSEHQARIFDDLGKIELEEPALIWISADCWDDAAPRAAVALPSVPRVLVCPSPAGADDLDVFISSDADYAARAPLTEDGVFRILRRGLEQHNIHQDMCRMAREIFLSRELLTRKSDVLEFLLEADRQLGATDTQGDILGAARRAVGEVLDVRALHAVLWDFESADDGLDLFFEGIAPDSQLGRAWEAFLLDAASRLLPYVPPVRRTISLAGGEALAPEAGHALVLPLAARDAAAGAVILLLPEEPSLSRDQSLALRMVMAHVACLLRLAAQEAVASLPSTASRISYDDALSRMRFAQ